jgi:hypothetical protein
VIYLESNLADPLVNLGIMLVHARTTHLLVNEADALFESSKV